MKSKILLSTVLLALGFTHTVSAQELKEETGSKNYPHMFFGIHGGAQTTFTNYKMGKLITPTYGASFGGYFNPIVGTRIHVSGYENKGGIKELDKTYEYKYVNSNIDLLLNVTNMFSQNKDRVFNLILFGGIGLQYAWDNDDLNGMSGIQTTQMPRIWDDNLLSHNIRAGLQLDFNITKHFGINMELAANNTSDRYNSKTNNSNDWQATASLGLIFKFGHKKSKPVQQVTPVEQWATRTDTIWYDDVTYKDVVKPVKMEENVYYKIRMSEPEPMAKVEKIVNFIKANKNCKVKVTAYADKGTGTPQLNMKYSKERAEKVVKALIDAGIDKNIITSEYKGDTVQPFSENDKNRVAIVVVSGEKTDKEKVVNKKFRTEEVKYKVKE